MFINAKIKQWLAYLAATIIFLGCATAPQLTYVDKAQNVTSQTLEPVMFEYSKLNNGFFIKHFPPQEIIDNSMGNEMVEDLKSLIENEIKNTQKFEKIATDGNAGEWYIIRPEIVNLEVSAALIPSDPTRVKLVITAKTKLSVSLGDAEASGTFEDTRTVEKRIPKKEAAKLKPQYVKTVVQVSFKAAADRLGNAFNPNYVYGKVSKLSDKNVYVQISTSNIPKTQRSVEVVDGDNKVLATVEIIPGGVEDGVIAGKLYAKSTTPIKTGDVVRARLK